ncbi:MAG: ribonuclease J [Deltaproteobacteria bacterium]|nr:ribonuclease J [Deltaproteobacteria bacterium]
MNAMLIGTRGRYVLVDCGVGFAPSTVIGADKMLPDLAFLDAHRDKIEAVLITHGHEDHIGALPWVLPALDPAVTVHASSFTTELIRHRLAEHDLWDPSQMRLFAPRKAFNCGPFQVEAVRVTHSIPDCQSVALRCEAGSVLHTADWKIDDEPMDGEHFDREGFEALGRDGIDLMLSDSTNALAPGRTKSEAEVVRQLEQRIIAWPGRVIVTLFASNMHRIRGLAQVAKATGRRLVLCGRSIWNHLEAAERDRIYPLDRSLILDIENAQGLSPRESLVVTTGSQGEARSALARAADGDHDLLRLGKGDLVLHSARIIPGNEGEVHTMWNRLASRGVELSYDRAIHTSGHAQRDELEELMRIVKPKAFVPVHGETTFLYSHAALAKSVGIPSLVLHNGERLDLSARGTAASPLAQSARADIDLTPFWNDGPATGDEDTMRLKERKRVAWNGLVLLDAAVMRQKDGTADVRGDLRIDTRALYVGPHDEHVRELRDVALRTIRACPAGTPWSEIAEALKSSVRAAARRSTDKRPEVVVVLHEGRLA